jgi:hypothetical protein
MRGATARAVPTDLKRRLRNPMEIIMDKEKYDFK